MHYNYSTILNFVVEILQGSTKKRWHLTRLKAFVLLLRGLLLLIAPRAQSSSAAPNSDAPEGR